MNINGHWPQSHNPSCCMCVQGKYSHKGSFTPMINEDIGAINFHDMERVGSSKDFAQENAPVL